MIRENIASGFARVDHLAPRYPHQTRLRRHGDAAGPYQPVTETCPGTIGLVGAVGTVTFDVKGWATGVAPWVVVVVAPWVVVVVAPWVVVVVAPWVVVVVAPGTVVVVAPWVVVVVAPWVVVVVVLGVLQVGTVIVSVVVETVPPKANALPVQLIVVPIVIPEASMLVPRNVDVAPSVVAAVGVQKTSQDDAPLASLTAEFATVVSAPSTRKMKVPLPVRVIPAVPMDAALLAAVQYTPGA